MEIDLFERFDARVAQLKRQFAEGTISEDAIDREIRALAVERAALRAIFPPPSSIPHGDSWVRLISALEAFCRAYLSNQPRESGQ
jgi:hypothetical protein